MSASEYFLWKTRAFTCEEASDMIHSLQRKHFMIFHKVVVAVEHWPQLKQPEARISTMQNEQNRKQMFEAERKLERFLSDDGWILCKQTV